MHSQNTVFPHPYHEIDPNFTHAHASICSTDLKFQYDTSIRKLNWRAKFQTVNRCRSLSFTLHVPSKYSVSTPYDEIDPNFTHAHTSICSTDLKFQYDTSIGKLNWRVKFQTINRCRSRFVFYTTCTVKIQCFHTPITKSTPISHARMLLYVRLTWNFSMILQLAS